MITLRTFETPIQRDILTALRCEQFQMFRPGTHGGNQSVERDKFHITHDVRNQLAKGGCRQCWRRFRIVMMRMGSPEFSWFLRRIVATSTADVQRGVAHAVMGMNTRKLSHGVEIQYLRTTGMKDKLRLPTASGCRNRPCSDLRWQNKTSVSIRLKRFVSGCIVRSSSSSRPCPRVVQNEVTTAGR